MIFVFGSSKREKNEKLINIANKIAMTKNEEVAILFLDTEDKEIHKDYFVDKIYILKNKKLLYYNYDNYFSVLNKFINDNDFSILLSQNALVEREILNSIANKNKLSILNDIVDFKMDKDGVFCRKNSFRDESVYEYKLDLNKKNILVVKNSNVKCDILKEKNRNVNIVDAEFDNEGNYEILRDIEVEKKSIDNAKIIFSGGRGISNEKAFNNLRKLAQMYNAAVAGSRPMVELGFINSSEQVGQTGNIVSPDVYIAFGISGSIQHLAGMKNSKNIIAINNCKNANIFNFAKYGVVDDANVILKDMLEILNK